MIWRKAKVYETRYKLELTSKKNIDKLSYIKNLN